MKGIVFEMFENFVTSIYDEEVWQQIIDQSHVGLNAPFEVDEQYQEKDFFKLADEMVSLSQLPLPTLLRSFGEYSYEFLDERDHQGMENGSNPALFVSWANNSICGEGHRLDYDSYLPHLKEEHVKEEHIDDIYTADKKLCYLYDGIFAACTKILS